MTLPLTAEVRERLAELELDESVLIPTYLGPTWKKDSFGVWILPEHTLGWECIGWCAKWLRDDNGKPWSFTNEQMRFILHWYSVDEYGEFIYKTGVLQRCKGWGKDPLLACLSLFEMVGPSRFSHWNKQGEPVGKPVPNALVQVAAVSQSQTDNTTSLFPSLMSPEFVAEYRVDAGIELIRANGGKSRLKAITSNYRTLEGGRSTFVVLNETHHWVTGNGGIKMYDTVSDNTVKMNGRWLAITNAYMPGEGSVAEKMRGEHEDIEEGRAVDVGFLYDSLEADERAPLDAVLLPLILDAVRGDAFWLNIKTIIGAIQKTGRAPARSRRMWLNQIVAEEDAVYKVSEWRKLAEGFKDEMLREGDAITLGFDGGKTDDATALVAYRISDGFVQILGLWEKPPGWDVLGGAEAPPWKVPQDEVDSRVHEAFRLYKVKGFYADVSLWESYITEWTKAYAEGLEVKASGASPIGWDMRSLKAATYAHEALMQGILDGRIHHNNDLSLKRHVMNARRRENVHGISFSKESPDSPKKVDAYAALMLAYKAASDLPARGREVKVTTGGRVWAF